MYQLRIDDAGTNTNNVTVHPNYDSAHRSLIDYVIGADYYLHRIPTTTPATRYELLDLGDAADQDAPAASQPRSTGCAVIDQLPDTAADADTPYCAAVAAQRWITDHRQLWSHGADTDPGARYPLAVLTAARAEARCWFCAGTLLREAAQLAGVEPPPHPDQPTLDTLRHTAIQHRSTTTAAELAAAVQETLPLGMPPAHTAALIWWFALLAWGVNAP